MTRVSRITLIILGIALSMIDTSRAADLKSGSTTVTPTVIANQIKTQTGCSTAGYVWVPASNTCVAAAPLASPALTGTPTINGTAATTAAPITTTTCGSTLALSFAATSDAVYSVSLTANCSLSINAPTSNGLFRRLILRIQPNGYQATLPSSSSTILNSGGSPPTPSTSAVTIYTYGFHGTTVDGGL